MAKPHIASLEIYDWYGVRPTKLDTIADPMFYVDQWGALRKSQRPSLLLFILFGSDWIGQGPGPLLGDPHFRMGEVKCRDYLGVLSEAPITASLLQARLVKLVHNTSVEIVDDA